MFYIHSKNTKLLSILDNFEIHGSLKASFMKLYGASIKLNKNQSTTSTKYAFRSIKWKLVNV